MSDEQDATNPESPAPLKKSLHDSAAKVVEPDLILDSDEVVVDDDSLDAGVEEGEADLAADAIPAIVETDEGAEVPSASTALVRYDSLDAYLSEIRNLPTLTREEEHSLALRYHETKDPQAAYRLVVANLRLVVSIAREYQRNFKNILDLIQEGNIGLLEAVQQFDPFRGIRFPSYAVYWIRAYMLRYLINNLRLVKIGTTQAQRKLFFNLQKEKDKLEAEGFSPEAKLLAERLDVKESEVIEMQQRLSLPDLSVDAPMRTNDSDDGGDLHQILPSGAASAEDLLINGDFTDAVREAVEQFKKQLDEKERAIVDGRLLTEDPVTLQEIADRYQLSRERIRQIEGRLKTKLRGYLQSQLDLNQDGEVVIDDEGGVFFGLIFIFALLGLVYYGLQFTPLTRHEKWGLYLNFFERGKPEIEFPNPPPGIGTNGGRFHILARDNGAGLDEVVVRVEQGADSKEVLRKHYDRPTRSDSFDVELRARDLKLSEGHFALEVVAFDRSFFSNGETKDVEFPIDFRKPQLQVISSQHNAVIGGTELAFYRIQDDDLAKSGVRVGDKFFPGTPASLLDAEFAAFPDLYFSLFAIPLDFDEKNDPVEIYATDLVGNSSSAGFYYHTQRVRTPTRERDVSASVPEPRLNELAEQYFKQESVAGAARPTDLLAKFVKVNEDLRRGNESQLRTLLSKTSAPVTWGEQAFSRPALTLRSEFGDRRKYMVDEQAITESLETGTDLGVATGMEVSAGGKGVVVFVGSLGVYGNTVVVDHGGGMATVYSHLSAFKVKEGETVERDRPIGIVGSTGFCPGEILNIEFRVFGEPVRSIEWWDRRWVKDHIANKISDVKRTLGVEVMQSTTSENQGKEGEGKR